MSQSIKQLQPNLIWEKFYDLTQIPRPSHHEEKIVKFLKEFGEGLNLETIVDEIGNVIIRKPATKGMEDRKGIILQAHMDMVPQKNSNIKHDFKKDPIETIIDGEWVRANETTLGADNGMGVSAALAVLESTDIAHGPIEVLLTATEETGMDGANGLKPGILKGDILLNLDSETEGELYIGCAGGVDANVEFKFKPVEAPKDHTTFKLSVQGLKGGHSGMDIHLGRGNANKILFRYLNIIKDRWNAVLASVDAGSLRNAIPREAFATVLIPDNLVKDFKQCVKNYEATIQNEIGDIEPNVRVSVSKVKTPDTIIDPKVAKKLILSVIAAKNGVARMSTSMPNLVETSSNLAIVKSYEKTIEINALIRSSVDSSKMALAEYFASAFRLAGAKVKLDAEYPGWQPNTDSEILKLALKTYKSLFNEEAKITAVHAGLECGILGAKYPNWDMISFGPTIQNPHSPNERVNISSVDKFYKFLLELLKNAPKK
ncbi:MAG: aminoacyl-histidine dipeptidase [Bacteroidales bacterium]|jgi:dipeptidase D